jgi:DNA-binding response OmpR family regulator
MPEKRILVVEDEPDIAEVLEFNLERAGFGV